MNLITLHRCKMCAKVWFPRKPETADTCPTCELTLAEADELCLTILESLLQGEYLRLVEIDRCACADDHALSFKPDAN